MFVWVLVYCMVGGCLFTGCVGASLLYVCMLVYYVCVGIGLLVDLSRVSSPSYFYPLFFSVVIFFL